VRVIEIQELSKDFAHDAIIKELNLDIHPGETLGLWGPPMSGLTTLMQLISGFLTPTTGRVLIDERNAAIDRDYISQILAYVPARLHLPPAMRVRDILQFSASLRQLKHPSQVAQQFCERLQLHDCWNLRLGHLPDSLKRLVSIAQALVSEPKILLIDEPLHPTDSWQKQRLQDWLSPAQAFAIRILSSHSMEDLSPFCSRILVIQSGRVIRSLTPDQWKTPRQQQAAMQLEAEEPEP
jgi:ABC-2 type transport system ATP-binding protein